MPGWDIAFLFLIGIPISLFLGDLVYQGQERKDAAIKRMAQKGYEHERALDTVAKYGRELKKRMDDD